MLMLLQPTRSIEAPRRVVALHLLSGLTSVVLLTMGLVQVVLALKAESVDSTAMTMMTKGASLVSADIRHRHGERMPALIDRFVLEYRLLHCAVIGPNGEYLFHSNPSKVGQASIEPAGSVDQFGEIEKHWARDENLNVFHLYRMPIRSGDEIIATLEAAVNKEDLLTTIASAFKHGVIFIGVGLACLAAGAYFLSRAVRPMATIETQLRRAATDDISHVPLQTVKPTSVIAIGWNKLIEEQKRRVSQTDLESKVAAGLRSHREKRAEAILRSLTDGIALTDHEDRITFANPSLQGILSSAEDELLGRSMEEIMHFSAGSASALKLVDPNFRSQQVVAEVGRDGDMTKGVLRIARVPLITSGQDASPSHVWMIRDITQQKLADQMRNQFVYSATHELRTPLSNIKAYAETLANMRPSTSKNKKNSATPSMPRHPDSLDSSTIFSASVEWKRGGCLYRNTKPT